VPCKSCGSDIQDTFRTEIAIHLSIDKPLVLIFPEIVVCLNCGKPDFLAHFTVPESELRLLTERGTAAAG
jgi:hypothetical protein